MSLERATVNPLNPRYPIEMQKLLANLPEDQQVLPSNHGIKTETFLINFYAAKTAGAVEAYDTYIKAPINTVIEMHNHHHAIDARNDKGTTYVMPAAPILIAVLKSEIEMGDKKPDELGELKLRLENLERFRNNPENQPHAAVHNESKAQTLGRGEKRRLQQIRGKRHY